VYVPLGNAPGSAFVTVRSSGSAGNLASAVRAVLREVDSTVPVLDMQTMDALVGVQLTRERLLAALSSAFGGLALLLVAVGLYGMIAGGVAARTQELGIRISLGARRAGVAWLVTRESATLVLIGSVAGLAVGAFVARYVEAQLFGVTPADPLVYVAAAAVLIGVAAVAAWLPALRATKVDPLTALRYE
jgi:ABC-type antimicrobial peptide transport system permease subunit